VITSADGAAMHDIVSVIRRRNPTIDVVIIPAAVQGDSAPESIVRALDRAARWGGADVLIVGRGGGSREDLWCFNDERVARAIAASPIPTVSAVGHEVDFSIADLVADHRAATPSAAAELVAPVLDDLRADLRALKASMTSGLTRRARDGRRDLDDVRGAMTRALRRRADGARRELVTTRNDIRARVTRLVERRSDKLSIVSGRLNALSPLRTLERGFAFPHARDGAAISRAAQLKPGMKFQMKMQDGEVDATVDAVRVADTRETA
jgi:exodeoxyribonuclease VII large subunit